ncbi:MAG: AraC family transcriptional regulator [Gemmiger sp.]|nr:AraC family transcriptional regulator [Gemmiger sp.]
MDIIRLRAEPFLELPNYGYASVISDPEQLVVCHCHDYYELFLVSQGSGEHVINGAKQRLEPGMLYFVRPDDVHYYDKFTAQFQIINVIIPQLAFRQFLDFVGDSYYGHRLLSPTLPPHTQLTMNEMENLQEKFKNLMISGSIMKKDSTTLFRIMIFNILTNYFPVLPAKNSMPIPDWLRVVNVEMTKKQNFAEGLPALYRLAGKSEEHICRACRKYLNKTPSKLVNDIRLEYAARQLVQSGEDILDICTDAGFDSLSHFYHLFRDYFGISPKKFRENARALSLGDQLPKNSDPNVELSAAIPLRSVVRIP